MSDLQWFVHVLTLGFAPPTIQAIVVLWVIYSLIGWLLERRDG